VSIAVLSLCYSLGTMGDIASAVSSYMHDYKLTSPYDSKLFSAGMRELPRYLGVGKAKKSPVEA
jgi:hypothetical protein